MVDNLYQLYLVTGRFDLNRQRFIEVIEEACQNGITCVQLREKELSTRDFYELALEVKAVTDRYRIPLIINDRVDICLAVNATGIHIGDDELPIQVTRQLIGPQRLLGVSAKSIERAKEAESEGANYVGVGAIFPTKTKQTQLTSVATLKEIAQTLSIPTIAIGGLNTLNVQQLSGSQIAGIAVVSDIMTADNPARQTQLLRQNIIQMTHVKEINHP